MKVPIHIKVDDDLKSNAERLFDDLGINMTAAITMFLKQSLTEQALPFQPRTERYYSASARNEVETNNLESFSSIDDWWESVNNED